MKALVIILFTFISVSVFAQTEGFYNKVRDDEGIYVKDTCASSNDTLRFTLLYAANGVHGGNWQLKKNQHDTYTYPVHGWWWFDSRKLAKEHWNLKRYAKKIEDE